MFVKPGFFLRSTLRTEPRARCEHRVRRGSDSQPAMALCWLPISINQHMRGCAPVGRAEERPAVGTHEPHRAKTG